MRVLRSAARRAPRPAPRAVLMAGVAVGLGLLNAAYWLYAAEGSTSDWATRWVHSMFWPAMLGACAGLALGIISRAKGARLGTVGIGLNLPSVGFLLLLLLVARLLGN